MERIKKENWEDYSPFYHILGVELENGNKYFLQPNCDGFVPVNLKSLNETSYSDTTDLLTGLDQAFNEMGKRLYKFDSMTEVVSWVTS